MVARSVRLRRASALSLVVASAGWLLAGCGSIYPGAAAVVGSTRIPDDQVDQFAQALCSANLAQNAAQGGQLPQLATRGARQAALQVLIDIAISRQFGEQQGVQPNRQQVSAALAQNAQAVAQLPPSQRESFRSTLQRYTEAQLMLLEIGRRSLQKQGRTSVGDNAAFAEGQRLRAQYARGLRIHVDPRFGGYVKGALQPGASSLSVPASDRALAGNRADPAQDWVSELPASQRCS